MKININSEKKRAEIWLTRSESADKKVQETLRPLYKQYGDNKYKVVVFMSGSNDLAEQTAMLLDQNIRQR